MARRSKVGKRAGRRLFSATANKTLAVNLATKPMRGGHRA